MMQKTTKFVVDIKCFLLFSALSHYVKIKSVCIFRQQVCDTIVEVAKVIQVKASAVDHLIKEIVASGVTEVREIMRKIREKLFPVRSVSFVKTQIFEQDYLTNCVFLGNIV